MRVGAVGVEVLHLAGLGAHGAELLAGAEGAVDHVAVGDAAQLGPHEGRALAGLDVLELDDLEDRAVDLEVVGADHGEGAYERVADQRQRASISLAESVSAVCSSGP